MKKLMLILLLVASAFAFPATVTKIVDGDTIKVKTPSDNKILVIRFADVDTPETFMLSSKAKGDISHCQTTFAFGKLAKVHLQDMLKIGDSVEIVLNNQTSHERDVATVYLKDKNINQTMVKDGFAIVWHTGREIKNDVYRNSLLDIQKVAKDKKLGLWNTENNNSTKMECLINYHK